MVFNENNRGFLSEEMPHFPTHTNTAACAGWRTRSTSSLLARGRLVVARSKWLSRLFSYYKRQIYFLLWVRVHNSPLINKSFSALLAQKPDYQFRFHGTHFAAPDKRSSNRQRHRGHSVSNPISTMVIGLTNSPGVHCAHAGEIRQSFLSFHNFVTKFLLCGLSWVW